MAVTRYFFLFLRHTNGIEKHGTFRFSKAATRGIYPYTDPRGAYQSQVSGGGKLHDDFGVGVWMGSQESGHLDTPHQLFMICFYHVLAYCTVAFFHGFVYIPFFQARPWKRGLA